MDGVVIIERETGALHFSKSFSHRFDVRHPKSDRMNLGALMFAFQKFAGNSFSEQKITRTSTLTNAQPDITLFETSTERIVLAQCHRKYKLLIVLFVHPLVDAHTAKSFVCRIAYNYDHDNSGLTAALNQNARLFRDATEQAINDEVDYLLQEFFRLVQPSATTEFIQFHYSLLGINSSRVTPSFQYNDHDDDRFGDDDTGGDDRDAVRCASVVFMSSTSVAPALELPISRSTSPTHGTVESANSLLASLKIPHNDKTRRKHNKNAIVDHAGPKQYQRFVTATTLSSSAVTDLYPPLFARALFERVGPFVNSVMPMMNQSRNRYERSLYEINWKRCPLPLSSSSIDLCIWKRNGCLLIYPQCKHKSNAMINGTIHSLLDSLEALARFSFKLQT